MRRLSALIPVLIAGVLVGGCQQPKQVKITPREKVYKKIVSLSPSATELIMSNGFSVTLAGRTAADNYPANGLDKIPVVLAGTKPDMEKLRAMKPDFVVYDADLFSDADVKPIKDMGADVFGISAKTVAGFEKQLYELSSMLGSETYFSGYIDKINLNRNKASGSAPKVAFLMGNYIAGTDSFQADAARNVGAEPVGPKTDKFVPLNVEQLVQQNPDVIIIPTSAKTGEKDVLAVLNDARLRTISAIKNKKLVPMDSDVVLRRGARVDKFLQNLGVAVSK